MTNYFKNYVRKKINETRTKVKDEYSQRLIETTLRYQKKYGFELNYTNGPEHLTWNCEGDAFKHVFGSALVAMEKGLTKSFAIGWGHENEQLFRKDFSNPSNEKSMDMHNNKIGKRIAEELVKDYAGRWDNLSQRQKEDIIADRVWRHIQAGDVILDPSGRRKLKNSSRTIQSTQKQPWNRFGNVTGYAADITDEEKQDIINKYRNEGVFDDMSDDEILELNRRVKEYHLFAPKNRVFYENEFRPSDAIKGSNDEQSIGEMFRQYYDNGYRLPSKEDLDARVRTGELVYVHEYTRADGTKLSGYYCAYPRG